MSQWADAIQTIGLLTDGVSPATISIILRKYFRNNTYEKSIFLVLLDPEIFPYTYKIGTAAYGLSLEFPDISSKEIFSILRSDTELGTFNEKFERARLILQNLSEGSGYQYTS